MRCKDFHVSELHGSVHIYSFVESCLLMLCRFMYLCKNTLDGDNEKMRSHFLSQIDHIGVITSIKTDFHETFCLSASERGAYIKVRTLFYYSLHEVYCMSC